MFRYGRYRYCPPPRHGGCGCGCGSILLAMILVSLLEMAARLVS